jgi:lipopolysaccharide/colanic/teichoic acid biosynthesis glycosyltransferase
MAVPPTPLPMALSRSQLAAKRALDLGNSILLLPVVLPVMGVTALLVKLDSPGPILIKQERIGAGAQPFRMFKFRSMYANADKDWAKYVLRDAQGRIINKREDDPRITKIGRFLRKSSLDEVPQLLNVLRGEMSLVGPRPEMPYVVDEYEDWQFERFAAPPGMTGWWQVHGRGDKPMHLNTEDDLYYIRNYSLGLDIKILFKTFSAVIHGRGAF